MHELPTLDELIDGDPRPEPEPGQELEDLRTALGERDDAHRATLDRLRETLLASEPAIDAGMVRGDTLEELEASFDAARNMLTRLRDAVRREHAAAIPTGAPGRTPSTPATPLEKIRSGLGAR